MNDYTIQHTSSTSTCGAMIVSAGLVASLLLAPGLGKDLHSDASPLLRFAVKLEASSKTYGQRTNQFTGEYENASLKFEETIAAFYEQLLSKQEPLGREFEEVLYDNLWDLLVHT